MNKMQERFNKISLILDVNRIINDTHDYKTNLMENYLISSGGYIIKGVKDVISVAKKENNNQIIKDLKQNFKGYKIAFVKVSINNDVFNVDNNDIEELTKLFNKILRSHGMSKEEINIIFEIANFRYLKALKAGYYKTIK